MISYIHNSDKILKFLEEMSNPAEGSNAAIQT